MPADGPGPAGRSLEALRSARRAVTLDPLSPEVVYNLAMGLRVAGDPEGALVEAGRALELSPGYDGARLLQGIVLRETGRPAEAEEVLRGLEVAWAGDAPRTVLALARIDQGDRAGGRELADRVSAGGHPFDQGIVLAALGAADAAFEAFDREALVRPDFDVTYWPTVAVRYLFADVWDTLRGDPRHDRLVRRIESLRDS